MQLASIEFPISFYGISQSYGNNFLYIDVSYNDIVTSAASNSSKVVIIPDGNYSAAGLVSTVKYYLNRNGSGVVDPSGIFSYIDLSLNLAADNSGTGKVTLLPTGSHAGNITGISLDFTRNISGVPDNVTMLSTKLGWALGFKGTFYGGGTTYTGESVVDPFPLRYFYLSVNEYSNNTNNSFINAFNKGGLGSDILARISLSGASNYFSVFRENDFTLVTEPRNYFGAVDITRLNIRILDDFGRVMQLNKGDYSLTINLKTVYDL